MTEEEFYNFMNGMCAGAKEQLLEWLAPENLKINKYYEFRVFARLNDDASVDIANANLSELNVHPEIYDIWKDQQPKG